MSETFIGVIGGSGIYDIEGLDGAEWVSVQSPLRIAMKIYPAQEFHGVMAQVTVTAERLHQVKVPAKIQV
jgi:purine nucleoside phosphorylase